jgi:hypothetical protein
MPQICSGMPLRIASQSDHAGIVEESLSQHDNHSGIIGPILRTMAVGICSGWESNIGGCTQ